MPAPRYQDRRTLPSSVVACCRITEPIADTNAAVKARAAESAVCMVGKLRGTGLGTRPSVS